jgi:signal transduction histidine kinase
LRYASDDDFADTGSHQHFVQNTLGSVENNLILADFFIIFVAAGVSFALAGKTLKPIQRSVEAQKTFASNASHELRTPIAVIQNDIEVYFRNTSPTKELTQKVMSSNLEEIKRMSGIVEDLLLLARSDNQTIPEYTNVDISDVTKNMVSRMRPLAESNNIKLAYTAPSSAIVRGAQGPLERMMLNILQNSIDHTDPKGSIDVKMETKGPKVILSITDTGSGIPNKDLPHIFTRFYKGNSDTGTGLGLSIVKEIVDQHRGSIFVESVEGKGTTVTIHLPLA